jgi:hypothetical protein
MVELSGDFTGTPQVTENRGWKSAIKGLVQRAFDNGITPGQPVAEAVVSTAPSIPDVVAPRLSPIMQKIEDARRERVAGKIEDLAGPTTMASMIETPVPEIAQAEITPPATPAVETTPWKPAFSQALMDSMVPRSPFSGKTYAEIEQERAKANADAAIARAGESNVDEVIDRATIKPEKPGIIERAGTLREGIGRRSARLKGVIASANEDRAGKASVQATLKKVAAGTVEPLLTTTAELTPEERNEQYKLALANSYVISSRKGTTETPIDTNDVGSTPAAVAPDIAKPAQ